MKIHQFKLICILFLGTLFISCSDNGVSLEEGNSTEIQSISGEPQAKVIPGGPPPNSHGPYIYGPYSLQERESGTYSIIPPEAYNITWFFRDTRDYPFMQRGTGREFTIFFILRNGNNRQISQVKATFTLNGETKSATLNVSVVSDENNENPGPCEFLPTSPPCPPPKDSDGDGVPDSQDVCPYVYGVDSVGCTADSDRDGVPDSEDLCPFLDGEESHGCPD